MIKLKKNDMFIMFACVFEIDYSSGILILCFFSYLLSFFSSFDLFSSLFFHANFCKIRITLLGKLKKFKLFFMQFFGKCEFRIFSEMKGKLLFCSIQKLKIEITKEMLLRIFFIRV